MTVRTFKCPFCGYKFRDNPERKWERGGTKIKRGKESQSSDPQPKPSVDLECPNCHEHFTVEVEV